VINGALCVAPPGVMARFRSVAPAARPELTAALAAAGDAPLVVALIPTADNRRVIEETLPVLPKRFGGGPSAVLTRGVTWATASLHLPPKMSAFFVVRSADPQAAQALAGWVNEFRASVPPLAPFRPEVGPAGVTFHVSTDELRTLIDKTVVPVLGQARAEAASAASQSNLHQILLAAMMYRQDHQKEWPDNLQQLTKYLGDPSVLRNPLRPDLEVGYDYRKPAEKAPANTAVVWEKFDQWPAAGVNVGYVDAAVGRMRDKERFDHVLEKGR